MPKSYIHIRYKIFIVLLTLEVQKHLILLTLEGQNAKKLLTLEVQNIQAQISTNFKPALNL